MTCKYIALSLTKHPCASCVPFSRDRDMWEPKRKVAKTAEELQMTELDELIAQKKEIEKKIKALTCPKYEVDGARMTRKAHGGKPLDLWVITVEELGASGQYKELVRADTKDEALKSLDHIIKSLQELQSEALGSMKI